MLKRMQLILESPRFSEHEPAKCPGLCKGRVFGGVGGEK